jgi:hypothetical protein
MTFASEFDIASFTRLIPQWAEAVAQFMSLLPEWRAKILSLTPAETFPTFKNVVLWAGVMRQSQEVLDRTQSQVNSHEYPADFVLKVEFSREKIRNFMDELEELARKTSEFLDEWLLESSEEVREEWKELAKKNGFRFFGDLDSVVTEARVEYTPN